MTYCNAYLLFIFRMEVVVILFLICLDTEKPGKPDAPEIGKTTEKSVSLKWKPPSSDGGAEIFNYVIEYRAEGAFKWVKANEDHIPVTEYTVKGLKKDNNYEFRISAENRAGVGPASEPTAPVKPKEILGDSEFLC